MVPAAIIDVCLVGVISFCLCDLVFLLDHDIRVGNAQN